jgi:ectoine hydroxylase-related dioxygenase (phytanoyl-CoA dioxygenase family)
MNDKNKTPEKKSACTTHLSEEQVQSYMDLGFLVPIRILSEEKVKEIRLAIDEYLFEHGETPKYELTDPILIKRNTDSSGKTTFEYGEGKDSKPKTFPFLFNLWKRDKRFELVAKNPAIAHIASQLLGGKKVHLMEDNVIIKNPFSKSIPWHQDFPYWPLATPTATTIFIAIDSVTQENGTMQVVPGSHKRDEETLPVGFGDDKSIMKQDRPNAVEISQNPSLVGLPVVDYVNLEPGECGIHHAMLWHGSLPNSTSKPRCVYVLRYVAEGTIWLGNERFPYDEVGLNPGDKIGGVHFPIVPTE